MKLPYIILMKVGPYCGYSLEEIIKIKKKEEKLYGHFFWGYSGVFCRPNVIQTFISQAELHHSKIKVLFIETPSKYQTSALGKFTHYSTDKHNWQSLPLEILLVGNQNKPHFAIVANNLKKINYQINLNDYCTNVGMLPDPNKRFDNYFRYRVDKACGIFNPDLKNKKSKYITISYSCELNKPYITYIK